MPYQPERAWCDDCGVRVPVSNVEFNKFGHIMSPILCVECEADRAFQRLRAYALERMQESAHQDRPADRKGGGDE